MAISKTVELKIKTVDETAAGVKGVQTNLEKIEKSVKRVESVGSSNVQWSGQLNRNIDKLSGSYDKLNQKAKQYQTLLKGSAELQGKLSGLGSALSSGRLTGGKDLLEILSQVGLVGMAGRQLGTGGMQQATTGGRMSAAAFAGYRGSYSSPIGPKQRSAVSMALEELAGMQQPEMMDINKITMKSYTSNLDYMLAKELDLVHLLDDKDEEERENQNAKQSALKKNMRQSAGFAGVMPQATDQQRRYFGRAMLNAKEKLTTFDQNIDTSFIGVAKLATTAAVAIKSVELGAKGANAVFKSWNDDVDGAAQAFVGLGQAIESIPLLGGGLKATGIFDYIFQFQRLLESEQKMTAEYEKRLAIAKQTQTAIKLQQDQIKQDGRYGMSSGSTGFLGEIDSNKLQSNSFTDRIKELNAEGGLARRGRNQLASELIGNVFPDGRDKGNRAAFINSISDEGLKQEFRGLSGNQLRAGSMSDALQRAIVNRFGDDSQKLAYGDFSKAEGFTAAQIKIQEELKQNQDSRQGTLTNRFNDETRKALADQAKGVGTNNSELANAQKLLQLRMQGRELEADKLQIQIETNALAEQNKVAQQEAIEFVLDRNKALKEAGEKELDVLDETKKINDLYEEQTKKLNVISQLRQKQLEIAERERKEAERIALVRQATTDSRSGRFNFANSVLQDRANAGDKEAEKILRQIGFEQSRASIQSSLRTAIGSQLGLGTFSSAKKAMSFTDLFSDTTGFSFNDRPETNDFINLPNLVDRQQTTGVRESYMDSIQSKQRNAELAEMKNVSMNTRKTNEILREMAINAITLEER